MFGLCLHTRPHTCPDVQPQPAGWTCKQLPLPEAARLLASPEAPGEPSLAQPWALPAKLSIISCPGLRQFPLPQMGRSGTFPCCEISFSGGPWVSWERGNAEQLFTSRCGARRSPSPAGPQCSSTRELGGGPGLTPDCATSCPRFR